MTPNPPGEARSAWPLLALALVSGLITMALSTPNSDATREAGAAGDMSRLLFNSPIQTPRPISVITDEALARVLGERDQMRRRAMSTPPWTATVTRTPSPRSSVTPRTQPNADIPLDSHYVFVPIPVRHNAWKGAGNAIDPGLAWPDTNHLDHFNLGWWYDWGDNDSYGEYDHPGFVPMEWCRLPPTPAVIATFRARVQEMPGHVWLVFNEPEHPLVPITATPPATVTPTPGTPPVTPYPTRTPTPGTPPAPYRGFLQCAETICADLNGFNVCQWPVTPTPNPTAMAPVMAAMAARTAEEYARIYSIIKEEDPTARVFCCGQYHAYPTSWWVAFMVRFEQLKTSYPSLSLDGIHLHAYPYTGSTQLCNTQIIQDVFTCMKNELAASLVSFRNNYPDDLDNKPFWITEYGFLYAPATIPTPTDADIRNWLMAPMVSFLGSAENRGFTNLAWFSVAYGDYRTRLMEPAPSQTPPSTLTVLGNQWASYNPAQPPTPTPTPTP
ncbi:MAG: hypothetical protein WAW03_08085 [Anaerolineae bacterium]|uniref:hypothetical protein n=1 Tax=Candidatus Amarolinea dominans TaxID=3140696 RepID=UPI003134F932|nr:hypothetical protein [Anaerolineae bacterium]